MSQIICHCYGWNMDSIFITLVNIFVSNKIELRLPNVANEVVTQGRSSDGQSISEWSNWD